jgi:hypothetical protein
MEEGLEALFRCLAGSGKVVESFSEGDKLIAKFSSLSV